MEHELKTILDYDECPVRHVIIEEKKEVWFVGSFALAMGLRSIMEKYFPEDYKGCLGTLEHYEELKRIYDE